MALNAIVLGITGISLIPLGQYFFPKPVAQSVIVAITAGAPQLREEDKSLGGHVPGIAFFDSNGLRIGFKRGSRSDKIPAKQSRNVVVDPIDKDNNAVPEYMSIVGFGSDAVCISYITVTPPGGAKNWVLFGDTPKQCGAPWYHSNLGAGIGELYKPSCFWVDGLDSNGKTTNDIPQGYGIHLPDFPSVVNSGQAGDSARSEARQAQYTQYPDTMCKSTPRFKIYSRLDILHCLPIFDPPLQYTADWADVDFAKLKTEGKPQCDPTPGQTPTAKQSLQLYKSRIDRFGIHPTYGTKRSVPETSKVRRPRSCFEGRVIISDDVNHSAVELCQSATSMGPDLANTKEGKFCDMCTREIHPLCSEKITNGCFDVDSKALRKGSNGLQARDGIPGVVHHEKTYSDFSHWK
ncbi:hypothetical protein LOZ58_005695 [Ophidiomyces ophidiicola]|nr:hypothetical protein LOZ58_005695 [Ophidiomyces ophidiicola]